MLWTRAGVAGGCLCFAAGCGASDGGTVQPPEPEDPPPPLTGEATITIDSAIRHQVIEGWEAHAESAHEHPSFHLFKEELFDRAVNELGINRVRLEVRSGAETRTDWYALWRSGQIDDATHRTKRFATVNDNEDPLTLDRSGFRFSHTDSLVRSVVLPLKQRLEAKGESLFINLTYVGFTRQITDGGDYHHDSPEEYAEFVLATHLHLRDVWGIELDAWEVILEPDNTDFWRGRQIGEALVASANRLRAHGFDTPFIAPSNSNMSRAIDYFDDMIQVPGVREELSELSYHRYGGVSNANLRAIADRSAQYGIGSSMLEHIGSGRDDLHEDLTLAGVSAWQQFALAFQQSQPLNDRGGVYYIIDVTESANPQIVIGDRTRYLSQYFRYVRRGAARISAVSMDQRFDPVAFINADGGYVVVIKTDSGGELSIAGLPAGTYSTNFATAEEYNVDGPETSVSDGEAITVVIPDRGVLSVYSR